jgi:hypothetical protein
MQLAASRAKTALEAANARHKFFADKHRSATITFKEGDRVLLSTKNLSIQPGLSKKLFPKFIGPFTVIGKVNPVAYRLHLPAKYKIHNVFHVSLLLPYNPALGTPVPPLPDLIDDHTEFEVDDILDHHEEGTGRKKQYYYQVKWSGYGPEFNTWEPASNLEKASEIIAQYWSKLK